MNFSGTVRAVFRPIGLWYKSLSADNAAFGVLVLKNLCFQCPKLGQDRISEPLTADQTGNALGTGVGVPILLFRSAEIQYGNNLADSIFEQFSSKTLDFSVYAKSKAMVRLFDGTTTQSSPECFPTPLEVLIERTKESVTVLSMQEEAAENVAYGKSRTVYAISGNQKDGYYAIHSTVHNGKTMVLDQILFYPRASLWEILKNGCSLYPAVWLGVLALMYFLSRFLIGKAVEPVEDTMKSQKEFIASASHELKAPLAVIQANAEIMESSQKQKIILDECSRMSKLVQSMLTLASSDAGNWKMDFRETDVDTLLIETWELFSENARKKNIRLNLDIEDHYPNIHCDKERISQVLGILLDNAISYSSPGQTIEMGAKVLPQKFAFFVIDHGPGIADAEKEKVFERFYSGDPSRTDKGHYGLGLSIAQEIVRLHRGVVCLKDTKDGGCTFEIVIPI